MLCGRKVEVSPSSYKKITKALVLHFYVRSGFSAKLCLWLPCLLCCSSCAELLDYKEEGSICSVLGCHAEPGHVSGQSPSVPFRVWFRSIFSLDFHSCYTSGKLTFAFRLTACKDSRI